MFAYMKGILKESSVSHVLLEVGGIGYKIYTPVHLLSKLPQIEEALLLYTSFVIRENSQTLYGFLTTSEKDLFEALQEVNGIGPKVALGIVGNITVKSLQLAISGSDIATLSKIPGIGKKTAERLIIEMRDKLPALFPNSEFQEYAISMPSDPKLKIVTDAMSALINLGYNQATAQKAIKKTLKDQEEEAFDLGGLITAALQNIH